MARVLVCDPLASEGLDILRQAAGIELDIKVGIPKDELLEIAGEYEAILVRSETKITADVLEKASRLRVVGRAGVGVDNIDVQAATRHGVIVINAPEGNTNAAAEHTLALIACLARHIPQACAALKAGKWARKDYVGIELKGRVLGVIGVGKIGSTVAARALGLGMKVMAYDPFIADEQLKAKGFIKGTLDEIYSSADFITVHMPLTPQTKSLIDDVAFAKMKDGVRIVNVARGGIVDEDALLGALRSGKVAAAALDVFSTEPMTESPLFELPNVIVTPHLGASTAEAQTNVSVSVAAEVIDILSGSLPQSAVNMAAVPGEEYEKVKPYMELAERLGQLVVGIADGPIQSVTVNYGSVVSELKTSLLTGLVLKGLLDSTSDTETNLVNVSVIAADRGIKVRESKDVFSDSAGRIDVVAESAGNRLTVSGVSQVGRARIVQVGEFNMDIQPTEYALFVWHTDRPNLIGPATTILGKTGVNIASMQVSRLEQGGPALMVINLDSIPSDGCVEEIGSLPGVNKVRGVSML